MQPTIQANAADIAALDDGDFLSELGQPDRAGIARGTRAEDDDVSCLLRGVGIISNPSRVRQQAGFSMY